MGAIKFGITKVPKYGKAVANWFKSKSKSKWVKDKAGTITGVKPFSKTGGKTVKEWKSAVTNKKFHDSIRAAGAEITGKLNKTAGELEKLTKTLKKQKDIIDK